MKWRWSATAVLSVGLAILVVLLAALQWRWLAEIEGHEYYRRDRRVGYATWLFKMIFEREIESLAHSMAAPAASRSDSAIELAARLDRWRSSTRWPELVAAVYLVEPGHGSAELALSRLEPQAAALVPVAWPPALQPVAAMLAESVARWPLAAPTDFRVVASLPAILVPSIDSDRPAMLLLLLDRELLARRMLPEIVRMVIPSRTFNYFEVAVAEAESGRILYSTLGIDRSSEFGRADVVFSLVPEGARPGELPGPLAESPAIPSSQWQPTVADKE
jgi:hypothetical protein